MALDRYGLSRGVGGDTTKEDYTDEMFMIDRTETPALSMMPRKNVKNTLHEWNVERLNEPMFNAYPDGALFDVQLYDASVGGSVDTAGWEGGADAIQATSGNPYADGTGAIPFGGGAATTFGAAPGYNVPERTGVYTQTSRKECVITRRAEKISKAGRRSEIGRIRALRLLELRRDMEMIVCSNQPTRPGSGAATLDAATNVNASTTAGINAWIGSSRAGRQSGAARYNTASMDATTPSVDPILDGGSGVFGKPTTAVDYSTAVNAALSEATWLDTHAAVREAGGKPDICMVPFLFKQKISEFLYSTSTRIMAQNQDHGGKPGSVMVQGAVDYYQTDYGKIQMVPNEWMHPTSMFLLDKSKWAIGIFDPLQREKIGKRRDGYEEMYLIDWCLICRHEGANGIIRDIDTSLDMVA